MLILHSTAKPNLIYVMVPMMVATFGQAFIFSNTLSGALQEFLPKSSGKASAIFSSIQMILISLLSSIIATLPNNNILPLALVVIILGACCAVVLRSGGRLRLKKNNIWIIYCILIKFPLKYKRIKLITVFKKIKENKWKYSIIWLLT